MEHNERMRIYMRKKRSGTPRKIAKGTPGKEGSDTLHTKVVFPTEMFDRLRDQAVKLKTSFSEQVRTYIEWGFMAEDE